MQRFYFHLQRPSTVALDEQGQELSSLDAVHQEAIDALQILCAADPEQAAEVHFAMESQDGNLRMVVAAPEALPSSLSRR